MYGNIKDFMNQLRLWHAHIQNVNLSYFSNLKKMRPEKKPNFQINLKNVLVLGSRLQALFSRSWEIFSVCESMFYLFRVILLHYNFPRFFRTFSFISLSFQEAIHFTKRLQNTAKNSKYNS